MSSRLLTASVLIGGTLLVSCVPYPENPPGGRGPGGNRPVDKVLTPQEQEAKKKEEELKKKAEEEKKKQQELLGNNPDKPDAPPSGDNPPKPGPIKTPKKEWPFANPVPGKEGFVFSPYNNKMVDVRGIPSNSLVEDPTYPPPEQKEKRFRVP